MGALRRMMSFKLTVRKGDTLDGLSEKFGVPRRVLLAATSGAVETIYSIALRHYLHCFNARSL